MITYYEIVGGAKFKARRQKAEGANGAFCGTPLGFVICRAFIPSVRWATLGSGVELLCSSFHPCLSVESVVNS